MELYDEEHDEDEFEEDTINLNATDYFNEEDDT
jgi:hypothetical protein